MFIGNSLNFGVVGCVTTTPEDNNYMWASACVTGREGRERERQREGGGRERESESERKRFQT